MAKSPEEKATDTIMRILSDYSLNRGAVAGNLTIESTEAQKDMIFDFALHIISQMAYDPMHGEVSVDRAQRYMIANAIKDAMLNEGYVLR